MTISKKQLKANKKNAQKGGVKTEAGKAVVKYNALKHGLLAQEVVITVGDGAESPEDFNSLLSDLLVHLQPASPVEEMLVEKMAVAYWRLRRAYRYEVGLIRHELDNATYDFYRDEDTDHELDQKIKEERAEVAVWKREKAKLLKKQKGGESLDATFAQEDVWDWFHDGIKFLWPEPGESGRYMTPDKIRAFMNKNCGWDDAYLWQEIISVCDKRMMVHQEEIENYQMQRVRNKLKLDVTKKLGNIPSRDELDRLLRYEGAIERQLYKAMNQLERLQRLRLGDHVSAPVEVDVQVNTDQNRSGNGFVS